MGCVFRRRYQRDGGFPFRSLAAEDTQFLQRRQRGRRVRLRPGALAERRQDARNAGLPDAAAIAAAARVVGPIHASHAQMRGAPLHGSPVVS